MDFDYETKEMKLSLWQTFRLTLKRIDLLRTLNRSINELEAENEELRAQATNFRDRAKAAEAKVIQLEQNIRNLKVSPRPVEPSVGK